MSLPNLDEICVKLLVYFIVEKKPLSFNRLYKLQKIKGYKGNKISKPTFSLHLSHLVEKELVTRTKTKNTQYVFYQFNGEKWDKLDEFVETRKQHLQFLREERENFNSLPPISQLEHVYFVLLLQRLFQLKYETLIIMNPENEYEYNLQITLYSEIWNYFKPWFFQNLEKSDRENQQKVLDKIEELIVLCRDSTFDHKNSEDKSLTK